MDTYIIHVSDNVAREKHIKEQLAKNNLSGVFINDGDITDLTEYKLGQYFSGDMHTLSSQASCGYKHLLAMNRLVNSPSDYALVLEDDIIFYENAVKLLSQIEAEIKRDHLSNFLISLEDSTLKYVKKSDRKSNKYLYPNVELRLAGAYIVDRNAAKNIVDYTRQHKCSDPIDWYLTSLSKAKVYQLYWSHPTLAVQGSLRGELPSLIDQKSFGVFRYLSFRLQRMYKRILYWLR